MEWVAIRLDVAEAIAETVASFLADEGANGVLTGASDAPTAAGRTMLEAHFPTGDGSRVVRAIRAYLVHLTALEPAAADTTVEATPLSPIDWEAQFRAHHRPRMIGTRLLVAPPWDVPPAGGRHVLVIEPGMAFGTGQHATTRTCLAEIEATVAACAVHRALDVGTGSGLLAAALAAFGVPEVVALDTDPAVLPLARANLCRNGAGHVLLLGGAVDAVRGSFDLVVANLLADVLVAEAIALARMVAPGGHLLVSGLLDEQAPSVRAAYPGFRQVAERGDERWRTLHLVRSA
jgi:ribosomal protein L11 methyltransferase